MAKKKGYALVRYLWLAERSAEVDRVGEDPNPLHLRPKALALSAWPLPAIITLQVAPVQATQNSLIKFCPNVVFTDG